MESTPIRPRIDRPGPGRHADIRLPLDRVRKGPTFVRGPQDRHVTSLAGKFDKPRKSDRRGRRGLEDGNQGRARCRRRRPCAEHMSFGTAAPAYGGKGVKKARSGKRRIRTALAAARDDQSGPIALSDLDARRTRSDRETPFGCARGSQGGGKLRGVPSTVSRGAGRRAPGAHDET